MHIWVDLFVGAGCAIAVAAREVVRSRSHALPATAKRGQIYYAGVHYNDSPYRTPDKKKRDAEAWRDKLYEKYPAPIRALDHDMATRLQWEPLYATTVTFQPYPTTCTYLHAIHACREGLGRGGAGACLWLE